MTKESPKIIVLSQDDISNIIKITKENDEYFTHNLCEMLSDGNIIFIESNEQNFIHKILKSGDVSRILSDLHCSQFRQKYRTVLQQEIANGIIQLAQDAVDFNAAFEIYKKIESGRLNLGTFNLQKEILEILKVKVTNAKEKQSLQSILLKLPNKEIREMQYEIATQLRKELGIADILDAAIKKQS